MTWPEAAVAIAGMFFLTLIVVAMLKRWQSDPLDRLVTWDDGTSDSTETPNPKLPPRGSGAAPPKDRRPDAPHIPS